MIHYNLNTIKKAVIGKGYYWFTGNNYDVNVVGVRRNKTNKITNSFDDVITVSYKNEKGVLHYHEYSITTDPGQFYMNNPMNKNGTAILVPDQYRSTFTIGLHQGKYKAIVQRKPVKVYRDADRDNNYDLNPKSIMTGMFGINIHRSNARTESHFIDKWSAGCQVFKRVKDFNEFMKIMTRASKSYGNSFTYTLLAEKDVNVD